MARKKTSPDIAQPDAFPLEKRLPPEKLANFTAFAQTDGLAAEKGKLQEIADLLWFPPGISERDRDARLLKALDLFESIKPDDGLETMLAVQMVGAHSAAVECLRRAMLPQQSFEVREQLLAQATRLMDLYMRQVAALDKHRGKGQQKITVERVHVASGGQAIVGGIETERGVNSGMAESVRRKKVAPPQITQEVRVPNPLDTLQQGSARKVHRREDSHD